MATISKQLAEKIIANDGYYSDDPRVMQVVRYDNFEGFLLTQSCMTVM